MNENTTRNEDAMQKKHTSYKKYQDIALLNTFTRGSQFTT